MIVYVFTKTLGPGTPYKTGRFCDEVSMKKNIAWISLACIGTFHLLACENNKYSEMNISCRFALANLQSHNIC